jgi:hypothetical protein
MKPPLKNHPGATGSTRREKAADPTLVSPDLGVLNSKARLGCSCFAGALHPCAERSHGVLLMTARTSVATLEAADKQGGAP